MTLAESARNFCQNVTFFRSGYS